MKVEDVLKMKGSKIWRIYENQTIRDALRTLVEQKIGVLLVFNENEDVVGILSERDIMRECHKNTSGFVDMQAREVMMGKVIIGSPADSLDYVMGIMTKNRIRHMPVFEGRKLAGIVSIGDVVKAQLQDIEDQNRYLKRYLHGQE